MTAELGMRNEELGIPAAPPLVNSGGWVAFLIPNSYFLILRLGCSR